MTKLDVVTGFLGAGKTTFLQTYHRWLTGKGVTSCIIENEFGAAGVDGAVLRGSGAAVRDISGGCVCCTLKVTLLVLPVVLLAHYLLYKTPFGMRTIAVGQNPQAAFVAGVNVKKTQYIAVMLGGLTCGMAGAYLSISYLSMFVRDMVSGRGFIAIAAILFGRYSPFGIFAAALFFGLADAMQIALQGIVTIPNEVIQCAPYLLTILAVTVNEARTMRRSGIK